MELLKLIGIVIVVVAVETMVRGLTLALEAVVKHLEGDVIAVGGTEH